MLVEKYATELKSIKTELSRYTHYSVFNCALNHLHPNKAEDSFEKMPWTVMFLLKLSLQEIDGTIQMTKDQFYPLANRIFLLADHLVNQDQNTFPLLMRAMLTQQLEYQIPPIDAWRHIFLQQELLSKSSAANDKLFYKKTGIGLWDFYKISLYLLALVSTKSANSVSTHNLTSLYLHLCPGISKESLIRYINIVTLPFSKLPEFMQNYRVEDQNSAELFQDTPFKRKPLIIEADKLVFYNVGVFAMGIKEFVLNILKTDSAFTDRFGTDVEHYVGDRLSMTEMEVHPIDELKTDIPIKKGLKADFIGISGNEIFIFESKSIAPSSLAKCSYDSVHLKKILKASFIKGILQGQETAFKLQATEKYKALRPRILIITLDEFYIYGGDFVAQLLDQNLEKELKEKYGHIPVPLNDVLYIKLKDFIIVTEWLKNKAPETLSELVQQIDIKQAETGGSRVSLAQHIQETIAPQVYGPVGFSSTMEKARDEMTQLLEQNKTYWLGRHVALFMRSYERFHQALVRSFS